MEDKPLWIPSETQAAGSQVMGFLVEANRRHGTRLDDYRGLHAWSVAHPDLFWSLVWDFCGVVGDKGERLVADHGKMPGARYLPDATLNFAENLIRRSDEGEAIVFRGEDKVATRLTFAELNALVSRAQQALRAAGVGIGDRVAAMLPNGPEAVALVLATTSIGAIWSSCSPDFGERGVLDRFGQIEPTVFVAVDGYWYNGKPIRLLDKLKPIVSQLPSARAVVIVDYLGEADQVAKALPRGTTLAALLKPFTAKPSPSSGCRSITRSTSCSRLARPSAEVHRARRRRHAAPASQGAPLAMRLAARRAAVLLHDTRLDDVELADFRPRHRRHLDAL